MVDTSARLRRSVPSDALAVGLPRVHAGTLHSTAAAAAFIRCPEAKSEAEDLCRLREFPDGRVSGRRRPPTRSAKSSVACLRRLAPSGRAGQTPVDAAAIAFDRS